MHLNDKPHSYARDSRSLGRIRMLAANSISVCLLILDSTLLWHYVVMIHWIVTPRYPGKGLGWDTFIWLSVISATIAMCATLGILVLAEPVKRDMCVSRGRERRLYWMKQFYWANLLSAPAAWILLGCIIGW